MRFQRVENAARTRCWNDVRTEGAESLPNAGGHEPSRRERQVKRLNLPRSEPIALSDSRETSSRILLVRPRKIGDVILCTPLIRALRTAFPAATLGFLTQASCADLLAANPHLDRVHLYPAHGSLGAYVSIARELRRARYDVVIDLFSSPATARLAWATGAPRRIGYRIRGRTWAYTDPVQDEPMPRYVVHSLADLLAPLGVRVERLDLELPIAADRKEAALRRLAHLGVGADDFWVALVPGAAELAKIWPAERYAALADWLIGSMGAKVLLLHGQGEEPLAAAVRDAMTQRPLPLLPPAEHLGELAALVAQSSLYVGADVGTRHMAIAAGVPSVGIFGPAHPESWTPPASQIHLSVSHDPGCKSHCVFPRCPHLACINDIPVSWVRDAILSVLPAVRARSHSHPAAVPQSRP
jgi:ADP-heptose:LPS heptosyltransferase